VSNVERAMLVGTRPSMMMGHLIPELGINSAAGRVAQPTANAALRSLKLVMVVVVEIKRRRTTLLSCLYRQTVKRGVPFFL
jgi:hypothetical protein